MRLSSILSNTSSVAAINWAGLATPMLKHHLASIDNMSLSYGYSDKKCTCLCTYVLLSRFLKFDSKSLASLLAYTVFVTSHIGEMLKEKIKNAMSEVNYFLII